MKIINMINQTVDYAHTWDNEIPYLEDLQTEYDTYTLFRKIYPSQMYQSLILSYPKYKVPIYTDAELYFYFEKILA